MEFKVFLSYSVDPEEQPLVWRLQTLAASHGVELYLPSRGFESSRRSRGAPSRGGALVREQVQRAIDQSDLVLAIITARTGSAVERELNYALGKGKTVIPIVEAGVQDSSIFKSFPHVFRFTRGDSPGKVESQVVDFLKQEKVSKENRQAVGALVAIGLGMLLLLALSEK